MKWCILFLFNSILLGVGLAMDAFSVSMVNGLNEPYMRRKKMCAVAGAYAFFQALMPMTGWYMVHRLLQRFKEFRRYIPWIALLLLLIVGGKMLIEGIQNKNEQEENVKLTTGVLFMQSIATSIDALSVGFTIAELSFSLALVCSLIISAVTFIICATGLKIGKKIGTKISGKASVFGGIVLIIIGIEIFVTGTVI